MKASSRVLYSIERRSVPTVQETEWTLGSVWAGTKNIAFTGVLNPDRPTQSGYLSRPPVFVGELFNEIIIWARR